MGRLRAGGTGLNLSTASLRLDLEAEPSQEGNGLVADSRLSLGMRWFELHIEVMVAGAMLDAMVCLASCDKTTPAHLMAAARLDIPTIIVPCGYQGSGVWKGKIVDIQGVYEATGVAVAGQMSLGDLAEMACSAVEGPGVCTGLGTATTMHMVAEALGMALPGSAPIRASSPRLLRLASHAGRRIVQMVAEDLRPRRVLTSAAFENAVMVTLAIAGSINAVRHLSAIAAEAELDIDIVDLFDRLGDRAPVLCLVRPNGPYRIEQLEAAGGTLAVMKQLSSILNLGAQTITGIPWDGFYEMSRYKTRRLCDPSTGPFGGSLDWPLCTAPWSPRGQS